MIWAIIIYLTGFIITTIITFRITGKENLKYTAMIIGGLIVAWPIVLYAILTSSLEDDEKEEK